MAEVKPNSHVFKENEEKTKENKKDVKVKKQAKIKEKTLKEKIKDAFIADEVHDVKSYVIFDVVIPAIKRTFRDLVMNTLDMSLFGKSSGGSYDRDRRSGGTYVSYSSRSSRDRDDVVIEGGGRRDSRRDARDSSIGIRDLHRVSFPYKDDAIEVLSWLMDNIEEYGVTSVADFISAANLQSSPIHHKWGWDNLQGSSVMEDPDTGEYYLRLPRPKAI